jgi:hypothetical protein
MPPDTSRGQRNFLSPLLIEPKRIAAAVDALGMKYTNADTGVIISTAAGQAASAVWESLEQRQMMSTSASDAVMFADGVLTVRVGSSSDAALSVNLSQDGQSIVTMSDNQATQHIETSKVRQIRIIGDSDHVTVDQRIDIPVYVQSDTVDAGALSSLQAQAMSSSESGRNAAVVLGLPPGMLGSTTLLNKGVGGNKSSGHTDNSNNDNHQVSHTPGGAVGGSNPTPGGDTTGSNTDPTVVTPPTDNGDPEHTGDPVGGGETTDPEIPVPVINGFSLIDLATGNVIAGYENIRGSISIDLTALGVTNVGVVANAGSSPAVGSVEMLVDGNAMAADNSAPYALTASQWTATVGSHVITATPFTGADATGQGGIGATLNLTVSQSHTGGDTLGGGNQNDQLAPTGVIHTMESTLAAGHAVHVNAVGSDMKTGTDVTGTYRWDFGDPGSKYNTLRGFNAAHVYDNPVNYTITLTLTNDQGHTSVSTTTVTITAAARKVIYVSNSGSDSNNGLSPQSALKTLDKAKTMLGDNTEILLERGGKFTLSSTMFINGKNVVVGAYGSDSNPNPVVTWSGSTSGYASLINSGSNSRDITIQDITFDDAANQYAVSPGGTNLAVLRCQFLHVDYGLNNNRAPKGVLMQDSSAPLADGLHGYLSWIQGSDHVYLGNTVANSTAEHCFRNGGADRVLVAFNNLTNLDRRNVAGGASYDFAKQTLTLHVGNYMWVYGNTFSTGRVEIGPLGGGDGVTKPDYLTQRLNNTVIEGNIFKDGSFLSMVTGADHTMVRDNVFYTNNQSSITVEGYSSTYQRDVEDLTVCNNTAFNTGTHANFLNLKGPAKDIELLDNLYVAPQLQVGTGSASGVYVAQNDLSSFTRIDGNIWPTDNVVGGAKTQTQWNALPQVGDDQMVDQTLSDGNYSIATAGKITGADQFDTLRLAA